ncbi:MAG: ABC transporter substrate binding protein [Candidatus Binatia bacterium]
MEAFRQELTKLGWIEGKNITIEYRFAEGKNDRLPELAADLIRLKVDLIVVAGRPPALAAKKATTTIPIVMANVGDPVGAGLIASLARPGGRRMKSSSNGSTSLTTGFRFSIADPSALLRTDFRLGTNRWRQRTSGWMA